MCHILNTDDITSTENEIKYLEDLVNKLNYRIMLLKYKQEEPVAKPKPKQTGTVKPIDLTVLKATNRGKAVVVEDPDGNIAKYPSIAACAKALKIGVHRIQYNLQYHGHFELGGYKITLEDPKFDLP